MAVTGAPPCWGELWVCCPVSCMGSGLISPSLTSWIIRGRRCICTWLPLSPYWTPQGRGCPPLLCSPDSAGNVDSARYLSWPAVSQSCSTKRLLSTSRFVTRKSTPRTHRGESSLLDFKLPSQTCSWGLPEYIPVPNTSQGGMGTSSCWASLLLSKSHPYLRAHILYEAFPDHAAPTALPPWGLASVRHLALFLPLQKKSVFSTARQCLFLSYSGKSVLLIYFL